MSTVFVLCGVSAGVDTRKPADMSDLTAIAKFASSAADLFLDAAKALPSPAEGEAALAAQDEKELRAMLAADADESHSSVGSASGFLSVPSSDLPVANICFVEPADAGMHRAIDAQRGLDAALDALEARQQSLEAGVAAALGWTSKWARHIDPASK